MSSGFPGHCSVFLHAEMFTTSASSKIFLLQIGAVVVEEIEDVTFRGAKNFFCAVRPSSKIVDNYFFHGDLETIFNMTKETENIWRFRRRFDVTAKRIVCKSEKSAICEFLDFILTLNKPVVFISVDEETLSVMLSKCKKISREKYEQLRVQISGFTYWSRTLKKLSTEYVDLEDYAKSNTGFCNAVVVAKLLLFAFLKVNGSEQSYINIKKLKRPHRHTVKKDGQITIEISSTFRNSPSCIITGEKIEQVVIEDSSDDSDVEILPDEKDPHGENIKVYFGSELPYLSQPQQDYQVNKVYEEIHEEYLEEEEDRKKSPCEQKPKHDDLDWRDIELKEEYLTKEEEKKNSLVWQQMPLNNNVASHESGVKCPDVKDFQKSVNLNFNIQSDIDEDLQKCHFCGDHYSSSSKHYSDIHKAEAWSILPFSEHKHKAYKYIERKGHKLPLFHMPQAGDSRKRKEMESNENLNAKRIKSEMNLFWPLPPPPLHPYYGVPGIPYLSPPLPSVHLHPSWTWNHWKSLQPVTDVLPYNYWIPPQIIEMINRNISSPGREV